MANNPAVELGGPSLNPAGRPKDTPATKAARWKKSKLRKTETALRELNPKALENIKNSVEGKEIDKEIVNTSKWVINTTIAVSKAAFTEELTLNDVRGTGSVEPSDVDSEDDSEEAMAEFSLERLPSAADLRAV